jgi:hypothetical protein
MIDLGSLQFSMLRVKGSGDTQSPVVEWPYILEGFQFLRASAGPAECRVQETLFRCAGQIYG